MHFGKELLGYIAITKCRRISLWKVRYPLTAMQRLGTPQMSGQGVIHLRLHYHATAQISFIFMYEGPQMIGLGSCNCPWHAGHPEEMDLTVLNFAGQSRTVWV